MRKINQYLLKIKGIDTSKLPPKSDPLVEPVNPCKKEYIESGIAKLVYMDFIIPSHVNAPYASLFANCANEQGKFQEMHDALFERQAQWSQGDPTK